MEELYDRQMRIRGLDQEKFSNAKVGIMGVGATGSQSAIFSAYVGVGCIRMCDFDNIEIHNVPRMIGITLKDVGRNKAEAVAKALRKLGNGTKVEVY